MCVVVLYKCHEEQSCYERSGTYFTIRKLRHHFWMAIDTHILQKHIEAGNIQGLLSPLQETILGGNFFLIGRYKK